MSANPIFGDDDGADDAYCADGDPDPDQVTYRLHELRGYLAAMAGDELAAWDALGDDERAIGLALGERLVEHLTTVGVPGAAVVLHDAQVFLGGQPEWDTLSADTQRVGLGLVDDLIAWLQREGSLR